MPSSWFLQHIWRYRRTLPFPSPGSLLLARRTRSHLASPVFTAEEPLPQMLTNKLKPSPLKVPKAPSLPCPFLYSLPVIRPPAVPNIISTKKDKVALPNNLKRSLDPKFTRQHSFSTVPHQAHLRVTDFWKNKATVSHPLACLFFSQKSSVGILHLSIYLFITGGKKGKLHKRVQGTFEMNFTEVSFFALDSTPGECLAEVMGTQDFIKSKSAV